MRLGPRRALAAGTLVAAAAVVLGALLASAGGTRPGHARRRAAGFSPVVRYTARPPTGYVVTFRLRAPNAKRVQLEGEWYVSNPRLTSSARSQGLPPSTWEPGDVTINPNAPADIAAGLPATWPLAAMTEDPSTGVWSYTTPLPSGVFDYGFVVNCTGRLTPTELANPNLPASYTGCPEIPDPNNRPWNESGATRRGSLVTYSQVYVPSDPAFHTPNDSWEAPASPIGSLTDVTYRAMDARSYLAIYTPPGYDAHRAAPYPTLYLSHGYDNNEIDWGAGGDAANILDNLIDAHAIEPIVVVMPNAHWQAPPTPKPSGATAYDENLLDRVIPYVESHYDVSRRPAQRAFAGLSYGGFVAGTLLLNDTHAFGYYGLFSPAPFSMPPLATAETGRLKRVGVLIGAGLDDGAVVWADADLANLRRAGGRVLADFVRGGHDWFVWRVLLHDFLTRVAFRGVAAPG